MQAAEKTILIIEDDPDIRELVEYNVERSGFRSISAADGEKGLKMAQELNPQLIILDIMLPGMSGLKVCETIRSNGATKRMPIIMLSAKGEEEDIVIGLEMGADDYLSKPFSPQELKARIRSVLRRSEADQIPSTEHGSSSLIQLRGITLDTEQFEIRINGERQKFTLAEFNLLKTLAAKPGKVFTRDQLLEQIAGADTYLIDRNIDVHIRAIRKKLGPDYLDLIETVRGVGYRCME
jgi:two-component system, OmpR family, alkaline phosphatase synthesis response regulator PhoP